MLLRFLDLVRENWSSRPALFRNLRPFDNNWLVIKIDWLFGNLWSLEIWD